MFDLYGQFGFYEADGMRDEETAKKLHELDDDAHVIASSEYANNPFTNDSGAYGFKAAVKKVAVLSPV